MYEENSTIRLLRSHIKRIRSERNELLGIVVRLAEGERSDDGHTSLREAAKNAISKKFGEDFLGDD